MDAALFDERVGRLVSGGHPGGHAPHGRIDPMKLAAPVLHDPEAYNRRGVTFHSLGAYVPATEDFGRALELKPGFAEAFNNRGAARHALGDPAGAIPDFDRALELAPCYAE